MAANFTTTGSNTYPAGITLQTEHMVSTTYKSMTSTSWTTTNLTDSITVQSATSVIHITVAIQLLIYPGAVTGWLRVNESTTSFEQILSSYWGAYDEETGGSGAFINIHDHNQSASTTLTYTINMRCYVASGSGFRINDYFSAGPGYSAMTLTEIQA